MSDSTRKIVGVIIIAIALFSNMKIDFKIPSINNHPVIQIVEPSDENKTFAKENYSNLITDKIDRIKMSLYFQGVSEKLRAEIGKHPISGQNVNDLIENGSANFCPKYDGLGEKIKQTYQSITSDNNTILDAQKINAVADRFLGVAWFLVQ